MDSLTEAQRPQRNRTKIIFLIIIAFVVIGFCIWFFRYSSKDPCFLSSEQTCIEYGKEQDALNPQVSELNYSFLVSPGKLTYPWISTYKKEEGSVILHIEIDSKGNIISKKISQSSGFDRLDNAAIESLSTFQIDLEKLNAKEFPAGKSIKLRFELR